VEVGVTFLGVGGKGWVKKREESGGVSDGVEKGGFFCMGGGYVLVGKRGFVWGCLKETT